MPKLELKPWKLYEPQIVWLSSDSKERLVVEYIAGVDKNHKECGLLSIVYEVSNGEDSMGVTRWERAGLYCWELIKEIMDQHWDIPERSYGVSYEKE